MIHQNEIEEFEKLGFELIDTFHQGIYGWQVFKSPYFTLSIVYDKCYYEASIHTNCENRRGGPILQVIRKALNDDKYFEDELREISAPNRMSPRNIILMLKEKLPDLIKYFKLDSTSID